MRSSVLGLMLVAAGGMTRPADGATHVESVSWDNADSPSKTEPASPSGRSRSIAVLAEFFALRVHTVDGDRFHLGFWVGLSLSLEELLLSPDAEDAWR